MDTSTTAVLSVLKWCVVSQCSKDVSCDVSDSEIKTV